MYRFAKQQSPFIIYYYYYYFPLARHVEQDERKDTGVFFFFLKDLNCHRKSQFLDIDVTLTRILSVCTFIFPLTDYSCSTP